jgi:hypothetical protein
MGFVIACRPRSPLVSCIPAMSPTAVGCIFGNWFEAVVVVPPALGTAVVAPFAINTGAPAGMVPVTCI